MLIYRLGMSNVKCLAVWEWIQRLFIHIYQIACGNKRIVFCLPIKPLGITFYTVSVRALNNGMYTLPRGTSLSPIMLE